MIANAKPAQLVVHLIGILRGEKTVAAVAAEFGTTEVEVQHWLDSFLVAGEAVLDRSATPSRMRKVLWTSLYVVLVTFALLTIAFFIGTAYFDYYASADWQEAGQRADFWGGHIAAAGSFAGTFLLFLAILLQYEELKAQRAELEQTRTEMRLSRSVAETQLDLAKENAIVTQVLELVRLSLEAEIRLSKAQIDQGKKTKEEEEFIAKDQHARVEKVLKVLFDRGRLPADVKVALQTLSTGDYGDEP